MIGYYILRDRIPFYISLIYFLAPYLNKYKIDGYKIIEWFGYYLTTVTFMSLGTVLFLLFNGKSLFRLTRIHWSFPSPITWGIMILVLTYKLHWLKRIPIFDSYYYSFLGALGSGWLYEILYGFPYWVKSGFASWNWLKWNPNFKVFLFEYQIFVLPLLFFIIYKNYRIKVNPKIFLFLAFFACIWGIFGLQIAPFFHKMGQLPIGKSGVYQWVLRIPVALLISYLINGVEKNE
jgi:hypothetical protein